MSNEKDAAGSGCSAFPPGNAIESLRVRRCAGNPLISFASSPSLGRNINGPSVIRVPAWVSSPLGAYYMYFAHHQGEHIRLAYAASPAGPWRIHEPGVLPLSAVPIFRSHLASPDVHVDHQRREIRMYFHGVGRERQGQWSSVALSSDGLHFSAREAFLGKFYFRVFTWQGAHYAIAKDWNSGWGELYRSSDGLSAFESRGHFIERMRHCAVLLRGDQLLVFHSRKGDAPERIVVSTVSLAGDWRSWQESVCIDVLAPEMPYEGCVYPNVPSEYGAAIEVRQLRDPCIFEEDGKLYLYYSVAGEMGIAMAELEIRMKAAGAAPG